MKSLQNILNLIKDKGLPTIARQLAREKLAEAMADKYNLTVNHARQILLPPNAFITKQTVLNDNDRFYLQMQRGFFFQLLAESAHKRFRTFAPIKASFIAVTLAILIAIFVASWGDKKDIVLVSMFCGAMLIAPLVAKILFTITTFFSSILNGSLSVNSGKKNPDSKESTERGGDAKELAKEAARTAGIILNTFLDFYFYLLIPDRVVRLLLPPASDYNKSKLDSILYFDDMFNEDYNELASKDVNYRYSKESNPVNKDGVALNTKFLASDALYGKLGSILSEMSVRFFSVVKNQCLFSIMALLYIANLPIGNLFVKGGLFCLVGVFLICLGILYSLLSSVDDAKKSPLYERSALAANTERNTGCTALAVVARNELRSVNEGLRQRIEKSTTEDKTKNIPIGYSLDIVDSAFNTPFGVEHGSEVVLEPQAINEHIAIFGQPGSGKTVLAKLIAIQCAAKGWGGACFDGKNGQIALELAGVITGMSLLMPTSLDVNPIENLTPDEIASGIIESSNKLLTDSAEKKADNPFFNEQGKNLVRSAVLLLDIAQNLKIGVSFDDLSQIFDYVANEVKLPNPVTAAATFQEKLIFLKDKLPRIHDEDNALYRCIYTLSLVVTNPVFTYVLVDKLQNIINEQPNILADIERKNKCDVGLIVQTLIYSSQDDEVGGGQSAGTRGTLENAFNKLISNPDLMRWNTAKTGYQVEDVIKGAWFGAVIGEEFGDAGKIYSILLKERVYSAIMRNPVYYPVFLLLEELQEIITRSDPRIIAMGRSKGAHGFIVTQSVNSIIAKIGESEAKTMFANCGTKIAGKADNDTAKLLEGLLGDSFKLKTISGHVSTGYRYDLRMIEASGALTFNDNFVKNFAQTDFHALDFVASSRDRGAFNIENSPNATAATIQFYLGKKFTMLIIGSRCGVPMIEFVDATPDFAKLEEGGLTTFFKLRYCGMMHVNVFNSVL